VSRQAQTVLSPVEAHELWAGTYDSDPNPLLALEERIVTPLLPGLTGMTVLDAACGTGRWLGRLQESGAGAVLGVDLSREMLRRAAVRPFLRGRLVQADCLNLPVRTASVDLALCSFAVGYLAKLAEFGAELSRVVKGSGCLLLSDFHPSARLRGWKRTFRHGGATIEIASFDHGLGDVRAALATAGFEQESQVEACFGDPERPIFEECGKADLLEELSRGPAIFVGRFRRAAAHPC
jgi:malonyl-CoA O-methyltransferase